MSCSLVQGIMIARLDYGPHGVVRLSCTPPQVWGTIRVVALGVRSTNSCSGHGCACYPRWGRGGIFLCGIGHFAFSFYRNEIPFRLSGPSFLRGLTRYTTTSFGNGFVNFSMATFGVYLIYGGLFMTFAGQAGFFGGYLTCDYLRITMTLTIGVLFGLLM